MSYLLTGVFIVFVITDFFVDKIRKNKRRRNLEVIARGLKMNFKPVDDNKQYLKQFKGFNLFEIGDGHRISNILEGEREGQKILMFDLKYEKSQGDSDATYRQSVIVFVSDELDFPRLYMRPQNFWDKAKEFFGFKDIGFESHPEFSRSYVLKGDDEEFIRHLFNKSVLDHFTHHTEWYLECKGDIMILSQRGKRRKAEEVKSFLMQGVRIRKKFKPISREHLYN